MNPCERLPELLADLFAGELDERRRIEIAAHLEQCAACRAEADELLPLWQRLGELPEEAPSPRLAERFHHLLASVEALPSPPPPADRRGIRTSFLPWAAALAALFVGAFAGRLSLPREGDDEAIAELRGEVASMTRLVTLSLLDSRSASERLQAVSLAAHRAAADDGELIDGLLAVVTQDPIPAVRIAAIEALGRFGDLPRIGEAFADALASESSPLAQITLLDALAAGDRATAARAAEEIRRRPTLDPAVRRHAEEVLGDAT